MATYKVHYIAKTEHGYGPRAKRRWEEKEFPTKWEAEKYCEEHRRRTLNAGYVDVREEVGEPTADDIRAAHTVSRAVDSLFSRGGRIF